MGPTFDYNPRRALPSRSKPAEADVVVVGGGAAGLATAIFCARATRGRRIVCVDGAKSVGAKILVSGGGRCNVTNRVVTERDFWGGDSRVVRNVLRAFPARRTVDFFRELGISLHEEEDGKLFPNSNRARTVLEALRRELVRRSAELHEGRRVVRLSGCASDFTIEAADGSSYRARAVVLATGGRSLPKTGSDGAGYELARLLGHGYVETTPALVPLTLNDAFHEQLSGVAHAAELSLIVRGRVVRRLEGALLWTHFGASGPVVLDASRHWLRARLEGQAPALVLNLLPGETLASIRSWLQQERRARGRSSVRTVLASRLPASLVRAWLQGTEISDDTTVAHLSRAQQERIARALVETALHVADSRGYNHAEVTAGGVPLTEVDASTMESRTCPGLFLVGEILDVDGRLGGFNFQWAWSSAWVAAQAIGRVLVSLNRDPVPRSIGHLL